MSEDRKADYDNFLAKAKAGDGRHHISLAVYRRKEVVGPLIRIAGATLAKAYGIDTPCAYCKEFIRERIETGHHNPGAFVRMTNLMDDERSSQMMAMICQECCVEHTDEEIANKLAGDIQGTGPVPPALDN